MIELKHTHFPFVKKNLKFLKPFDRNVNVSMPRIVYIGIRQIHATHRAWFSSVGVITVEPLLKDFRYSFMLNVLLSPFRRSLRNVDAVFSNRA